MHFTSPLILLSVVILGQALTPSSFLSDVDKERLQTLFDSSLNPSADVSSLAYSILGYTLLGLPIPTTPYMCLAMEGSNDDPSVETLYLTTSAAAVLGCPFKLGATATAAVKNGLGSAATAASLFFSVKTESNLAGKGKLAFGVEVKNALTAALKKDDSLLSLGLAFHTAAMLEGDMTVFYDRIEDAIVQADEVDGKMLQFEGGLSVTSMVLTGAFALAEKVGKPVPMTGEQAVKFANYLMSRKSVQQSKGGFHLLEAIHTMANNKQHIPVSVSLEGSMAVSVASPMITLLVSDLVGGSLGPMAMTLESATRREDGAVILVKEKLEPVQGDGSRRYSLDMMKSGPPAGFYELLVSAMPVKADPRLVGNSKVMVPVKILTTLGVEDAEIRIAETDQATDGKTRKLNFPGKLTDVLSADNSQQIKLKFSVKDEASGSKMLVHQAFVRMSNKETGAEIIYVAQANNNKIYSFDLDIGGQVKEFKSASGVYSVSVVLGDATVTNPVAWVVADIHITFGGDDTAVPVASIYSNKPAIKHTFRLPEKRPSEMVSNLFTIICLSPILLVLGLWMKLGVNVSNFPVSLVGFGFHGGLGAIFTLYMYFFLQLNMFTTVKYLVLIGLVTFLCGNSLLSKIARNNSKK